METQPMLEVLSTWSLETLAVVVVVTLVVSVAIGLMQGRKR